MSARPVITSSDPRHIFQCLARHRVNYVVIGGIAVIAHGHTRNTRDVDLVPSPESANFKRLAAALREMQARLSGVDAHLLDIDVYDPKTLESGANFTLETDAGGLDVFGEVPGAPAYKELNARSLAVDLGGFEIRIAGLDDLIRMKQAAGRPQDLGDIAALTALEA
ncbi:MAG: hypothetical protein H0V71_00615 [Chloroflexi bacterium]|nr:hypothetical protein [Chloroflexota bacterium]MDQ3401455.1 hypothetical protein [Chloroflexota bacterium]